jgi:hypothetical protein
MKMVKHLTRETTRLKTVYVKEQPFIRIATFVHDVEAISVISWGNFSRRRFGA